MKNRYVAWAELIAILAISAMSMGSVSMANYFWDRDAAGDIVRDGQILCRECLTRIEEGTCPQCHWKLQ